jgi:oligopeptide transport system ATP-binding protein
MALLEVSGLTISLTGRGAAVLLVDNVSFEVAERQILGIAGESGSGKSLSMLALLNLLPAGFQVSGRFSLLGRPFVGGDEAEHAKRGRDISIVFQDPTTSLHPMLSIGLQLTEHVRYHLKLSRRQATLRALELLNEVRIPDPQAALHAYPHQLSGGMRQRVAIAIALACGPKVIIADEPTTDLDVTVQASILRLLDELRHKNGMAIILITHDLGVMSALADETVILYAGRIVESGSTHAVLRHPRHPYTEALLRSLPAGVDDPTAELIPITGTPPGRGNYPSGCSFHPRCQFQIPQCCVQVPALVGEEHRVACWVDPFRGPNGDA